MKRSPDFKHQPLGHPSSSMGDSLFATLPLELRAQIFAHLLIRPVKWDTLHRRRPRPRYPRTGTNSTSTASNNTPDGKTANINSSSNNNDNTGAYRECQAELFHRHTITSLECIPPCASDYAGSDPRFWRRRREVQTAAAAAAITVTTTSNAGPAAAAVAHDERPITVAPWQSTYAPEQRNKSLCSECYERKFRGGGGDGGSNNGSPEGAAKYDTPRKALRSLPCLCARRQHLQVLLVCRAWYEEVGYVFYTGNTFAFGHPDEVLGFLGFLRPRWKALVRRVSFMVLVVRDGALGYHDPRPARTAREEIEMTAEVARSEEMEMAWSLLARDLPGLRELEIDAVLLAHEESARMLQSVEFVGQGLKTVKFVQGMPGTLPAQTEWHDWRDYMYLWPRFAGRREIPSEDGSFAAEVARLTMGKMVDNATSLAQRQYDPASTDRQNYVRRFEEARDVNLHR
ncbi:uncharacterized protein B0I36DRAFT_363996 [Microdochium trichocladiopsis]|uniref:Uncharacterized protein n=1 Tax=Microdochium trichocladiopsis TaxID=1682393 RepID=A0A9P9BT41_9PEZI|nr:uncharacterized protein B0I36DRAFT_363996 [Microdochium trichocladiopsis]KAH7029456.1 hypothetical protein B0I36DRAFT_363996 [Microdochium trichocladiopsis]